MAKNDLANVVSFSYSNAKMGKIPSVSLPPYTTCYLCGCWQKCYAAALQKYRPSVRAAWERNLSILQKSPTSYWYQVKAVISVSRFFRFHVAGDIVDRDYFGKNR